MTIMKNERLTDYASPAMETVEVVAESCSQNSTFFYEGGKTEDLTEIGLGGYYYEK